MFSFLNNLIPSGNLFLPLKSLTLWRLKFRPIFIAIKLVALVMLAGLPTAPLTEESLLGYLSAEDTVGAGCTIFLAAIQN